ncbi:hypothetical protein LTR78_001733 [Recurvomyces mirabilis]|uniref:DUF8212 domain-containing protein n=1 Tax=Recurvomyces mirabilis TaxID=574656 RepID=A0AAE0WV80_9PEZI|nr:hypothetical protein LTR78_001733 [Recurvomyces mirabilis]KAK5150192.1 hypothetical protein LTS14_010321 [Recurvomyces mirabilis]
MADHELLDHKKPLSAYTVAARMSWAAHRCTTREEDQAYGLLGLFSIKMPLLYGEGTKAFLRLQEEILRLSADLSILAWPGAVHGATKYKPDLARSIIAHNSTMLARVEGKLTGVVARGPDDLFAPSPLFFQNMGDIILDPRLDDRRTCNLTNTAL